MRSNILRYGLTIVILGAVFMTACGVNLGLGNAGVNRVTGSGKVVTESRNVNGFSGVVMNGAGKLYVDRTGQEALSITTDDNLMQYILTDVRGGKLFIEFKPNVIPGKVTDLTFNLTARELNSVDVNGAAVVEVKNVQTDRFVVNIGGAGAIKAAGQADQQEVTLNGAGGYNSEGLEGKRATVTNNGAGAAVVRVSDELNATINGIGLIEYIGSPRVTQSVNGLGAVRQRQE